MSIDIDGCTRVVTQLVGNNTGDTMANFNNWAVVNGSGTSTFSISLDGSEITITRVGTEGDPIQDYVQFTANGIGINSAVPAADAVSFRVQIDSIINEGTSDGVYSGTQAVLASVSGASSNITANAVDGEKISLTRIATSQGTNIYRVGIGCSANESVVNSVTFRNPQATISDLTDVNDSEACDELYLCDDFPLISGIDTPITVVSGGAAITAKTVSQSGKKITDAPTGVSCVPADNPHFMAWNGDSFASGFGNLIRPFIPLEDPRYGVMSVNAQGGRTLQGTTNFSSLALAGRSEALNSDVGLDIPWALSIHLGINDLTGPTTVTSETLQGYVKQHRDLANAAGAYLVFNDTSPFKEWTGANWTQAQADEQRAYRDWAATLTFEDDGMMGVGEYDVLVNLGGGGVADTLFPAYESVIGDGLHINGTGYGVLAPLYTDVFALLPSTRAVSGNAPTLTGPLTGPLTSSLTSNLTG